MYSAHPLIMLYICVTFHENILNRIRAMEWTRMIEALMDGQTDTQNFVGYNIIPLPLFVDGHNKNKQIRKITTSKIHREFMSPTFVSI